MADPVFKGTQKRTLEGSVADWDILGHVRAPEGAPNVLLVLIDDAGFGNAATFGGDIDTPNFTRVAEAGLRYNRFHVTALCSPTRAALLTGRNHHAVGFRPDRRVLQRVPGVQRVRPGSDRAVPEGPQGERLFHCGVREVAPDPGRPAGAGWPAEPLAQGLGFRALLGFLGRGGGPVGSGDHRRRLHRGGTHTGKDGKPYYFPDDMADKTIEWLHGVRAQDPDKPWFVYFSTGCSHAPHQVPPEWAAKYKGRFDGGWDAMRERVFARQKQLGVVPPDAQLTPRNEAFPAWESLGDDQKALYTRQMEVYAGYSENADWNVGRVLDAIEDLGELDNTLVIYIWGDNGASMEGSLTGTFNELTMQNGIPLTAEQQLALVEQYGGLDVWGTELTAPHYAAAWAWAGNCPFQWGKQMASHLGGSRNPMAVSWPARITEQGGLRSQFTHVIDVGPTILDIAGIPGPTHVNGIEQQPFHGTSFLGSLTDANAAEHRTQQYFEVVGYRAMYKDGWWLSMVPPRIPWDLTPAAMARLAPGVWVPDDDPVELYYLPDDFTQANDLAASNPAKVAELRQLFWAEAERYQVLPLLGGLSVLFGIAPPLGMRTRFTYHGDVQNIASGMIPRVYGHSYTITAHLDIPDGGAEGVIIAEADHLGGFSLFVKDGKLRHTYSMMGVLVYKQEADEPLPTGAVTVGMEFHADRPAPATGGDVRLIVNEREVGKGRMDFTVPLRFSGYAGMDIGRDNGGVVDRDYADQAPFAFTGTIKKVVFDIIEPPDPSDQEALHVAHHQGLTGHGVSG